MTSMLKFRLLARTADQVHQVADGLMPPFQTAPQYVVWGERIFLRDNLCQVLGANDYIEAFGWYHVLSVEGENIVAVKP